MGRNIDKAAIIFLTTFVLYLFFIGRVNSIAAALSMTFASMVILRKPLGYIPRKTFGRKRYTAQKARNTLEQLSLSANDSTQELLRSITARAYPLPDGISFEYILRHPSYTLTADDIAAIWKKNCDASHVVVIALPNADIHAVSLASRLKSPEIAIVDGSMLSELIVSDGTIIEPDSTYIKGLIPERRSVRIFRAASRAHTGKCTLTGIIMFAIYLITCATPYLLGSMVLLFIAGISIKRSHMPQNLFGH